MNIKIKHYWLYFALGLLLMSLFIAYRAMTILKDQGGHQLIVSTLSDDSSKSASLSQVAGDKVRNQTDFDCACETKFDQPRQLTVTGEVIATFVAGTDLGLLSDQTIDGYASFYVLGSDQDYTDYQGRRVRVVGKAIGVTCAYGATVFKSCSLEVVPEQVIGLD